MIIQTLDELEKDLRNAIRPVYLVTGPEEYFYAQAIRLLKKHLLTPGAEGFDYSEFTAGETPVDEILNAANIYPMLSKRRLVLVQDADKFKDSDADDAGDKVVAARKKAGKSKASEQETLLNGLASISSRSAVILAAVNMDKRKKLYTTMLKSFCVCEFPLLKGVAMERWAADFIQKRGYRISTSSIKKIVALAGVDLQTLASELEKLTLYAGEEKNIPDAIIDDLVRSSPQQTIFNMTDAVGRRDLGAALKMLTNLLGMGEHPLVVVTMLARHCRQMLIAKEGLIQGRNSRDIASDAQIPPFKLEEFLGMARRTDMSVLQEMYVRLASIDRQLKSSSLDGKTLLEGFLYAMV